MTPKRRSSVFSLINCCFLIPIKSTIFFYGKNNVLKLWVNFEIALNKKYTNIHNNNQVYPYGILRISNYQKSTEQKKSKHHGGFVFFYFFQNMVVK